MRMCRRSRTLGPLLLGCAWQLTTASTIRASAFIVPLTWKRWAASDSLPRFTTATTSGQSKDAVQNLLFASFQEDDKEDEEKEDDDEDEEDDDEEDDDYPDFSTLKTSTTADNTDWYEAELTVKQFPPEPNPKLTADEVFWGTCRSLQLVDYPGESDGLARIFPYMTWECRKVVTARQGGNTVENFIRHGVWSPALQPLMGAQRLQLLQKTCVGAGSSTTTTTRGEIMSFALRVTTSPMSSFRHAQSGMMKHAVSSEPPQVTLTVRLEKQRRPPLQECWLVREVLDIRHAFAGDMGNAHVGA